MKTRSSLDLGRTLRVVFLRRRFGRWKLSLETTDDRKVEAAEASADKLAAGAAELHPASDGSRAGLAASSGGFATVVSTAVFAARLAAVFADPWRGPISCRGDDASPFRRPTWRTVTGLFIVIVIDRLLTRLLGFRLPCVSGSGGRGCNGTAECSACVGRSEH